MPQFSFGFGNQRTDTPSYSWLDAIGSVTASYLDYQAQFLQEIPTGGRFNISLYSYKSDTTAKFQTINPRYGSRLSFNFTQPLLKNFGFKNSKKEIIVEVAKQRTVKVGTISLNLQKMPYFKRVGRAVYAFDATKK